MTERQKDQAWLESNRAANAQAANANDHALMREVSRRFYEGLMDYIASHHKPVTA